jgi:hypothetical protein
MISKLASFILSFTISVALTHLVPRRAQKAPEPAVILARPLTLQELAVSRWFGEEPEQAKAWADFLKDGRYRAAAEHDFNIPQWALEKYGSKISRATQLPIAGEDLRHNGSKGFVVIVVDSTRPAPANFGVVVFDKPKGRKRYNLSWLCSNTNKDLSRSVLATWSGGLELIEYRDDGYSRTCYTTWSPQWNRFICDSETMGRDIPWGEPWPVGVNK